MARIIKDFAPSWPAIEMGTGILPIALNVISNGRSGAAGAATAFLLLLCVAMLVAVTVVTLLRIMFHGVDSIKEINHAS